MKINNKAGLVQVGSLGVYYPELVDFRKVSQRYSSVTHIVIHYTAGDNDSAEATIRHAIEGNRPASFHFCISPSGEIMGLVPLKYVAWHCRSANQYSIGIECLATRGETLSEAQNSSLVSLIRAVMEVFQSIQPESILAHRWMAPSVEDTNCPGDLFGAEWSTPQEQLQLFLAWRMRHFGA